MSEAHKSTLLPIKNRVLSADDQTAFLAHYDLNEHDVLRGVKAIGQDKALSLNTSIDRGNWIEIPYTGNQLDGMSQLTLEAWFRSTEATGDHHRIISSWTPSTVYQLFINSTGGGVNQAVSFEIAGKGWFSAGPVVRGDGKWHHAAGVYDGTNMIIYVDGIEVGRQAATGLIGVQTGKKIGLGCYPNGSDVNLFPGDMGRTKIWNRALSSEEVKMSMNNIQMNESGLVGFWKLDDGQGQIARDSSTLQNDGIIYKSKWTTGNSVFTLKPQEGKFGGAIAIEEGTTNLETNNPVTFQGYTWSWTTTQVVEFQGRTCLKINVNCPGGQTSWVGAYQGFSFTGAIGDWCTRSAEYYVVPGGQHQSSYPRIAREGSWTEGNTAQNYDMSKVGTWQKLSVSGKLGATSAPVYFYLMAKSANDPTPINYTMYLYHPQAEKKAFPTSFINGTRGTGSFSYANPLKGCTQFTISCWVKLLSDGSTIGNGKQPIITVGGGPDIFWGRNLPSKSYGLFYNGVWNIDPGNLPLDVGTWYHVAMVADGTNISIYYNGQLAGSATNFIMSLIADANRIGVGCEVDAIGYRPLNGMIDELRFDKVARTPEEIQAWYQSNSPFWPRGIYRKSY